MTKKKKKKKKKKKNDFGAFCNWFMTRRMTKKRDLNA